MAGHTGSIVQLMFTGRTKSSAPPQISTPTSAAKGMYNDAILGAPRRINDEVEERELIRKDLNYLI